ncbi:MAG: 5-formyltetrahydrofolate cyclo-ligase [Rhodospirillales bacterium]|nr:5-formyltetrahydrofolate cyclo-ligase [Rhodospirillales bacterium]
MPLAEEKKRLRARAQDRRSRGVMALESAANAADRLARNYLAAMAAMNHPAPGAAVSGFWPMGDEIDARPLLTELHRRGYRCALPVVTPRGTPLVFRAWAPGDTLEAGVFGTSHPPAARGDVTPDVVLAPLLAFDREGFRLGYGGGFYDRTLASLRRWPVLAVGVGYSFQEIERVPRDGHDQRLDWIVTEERAAACGAVARVGAQA